MVWRKLICLVKTDCMSNSEVVFLSQSGRACTMGGASNTRRHREGTSSHVWCTFCHVKICKCIIMLLQYCINVFKSIVER